MTLIAYQTQVSYVSFPSRPLAKEVRLKSFVASNLVGKSDRNFISNCHLSLSIRSLPLFKPKVNRYKISAFKGTAQNDESGARSNGSKFPSNSVKLSYVPHEDEETITESPKVCEAPLSYSSEGEETMTDSQAIQTIAGSPAIRELFKKWLMLLQTQSSNQASNGIFAEGSPQYETSGHQDGGQKREGFKILKAAWCYFIGLDATIKIPVVIFVPWYLAVNFVYGAEVTKELTPLWTIGPLIVALYIKMLQGLYALYAFSFKQTLRILKNLPTYYMFAYNYMAQGKLKADLYARFCQPVVNIRNLDYKELSKRKLKELEVWAVEKYLDYVESIWPYYCRTIRFLKKANLI